MTDGLAILAAWIELGLVVGGLLWALLHHGQSDPMEESRHTLTDGDADRT